MSYTSEQGNAVVLRNITFDTYRGLLESHTDQNAPRFTYDRGTLEIMSPLTRRHEEANRTLAKIVETILDTWERDYVNIGSTTYQSEGTERGFEPDTGFYVQHAEQVAGKDEIDVQAGDPAPDLVIEVDVTSPSLPRFPIYAAFGVPEIWRCLGGTVSIFTLAEATYTTATQSVALPAVTPELLTEWLMQSRATRRSEWVRMLQTWAKGRLTILS